MEHLTPEHLTWSEILLRTGAAALLPFLIGLERFVHRKPIDFRPFVIVSVAACGLALSTTELAGISSDAQVTIDPTRVYDGVITGIGFLGAGAMFRHQDFVVGAGSAAAIWAAGAIGLLCGMGFVWLALVVTVPVLATLLLSAPFVRRYDNNTDPRDLD